MVRDFRNVGLGHSPAVQPPAMAAPRRLVLRLVRGMGAALLLAGLALFLTPYLPLDEALRPYLAGALLLTGIGDLVAAAVLARVWARAD